MDQYASRSNYTIRIFTRHYLPIVITPLLVLLLHILPDIFFSNDFLVNRQ